MRLKLLAIASLIPSLILAQVQIDPPTKWIELEVPSKLPPGITYMRKVASADQSVQVSVLALKAIKSLSGAEEAVAEQIKGMKTGGFILDSVANTNINGFTAKHIVGEFRSDQYESAYLVESWILFSELATVSISVSIDSARGGRELADDVHRWINISGSPATLQDRPESLSMNHSIGEKIGRYTVYAAFGFALIGIVRKLLQRGKATRAKPCDAASDRPDS
jgi:formyltetrahydrofolate synthetase